VTLRARVGAIAPNEPLPTAAHTATRSRSCHESSHALSHGSLNHSAVLSHWLLLEIEDTGAGIASDELDTLFDAFTQTEAGRQSRKGTGLGLFISRQLVQLLQGAITVESAIGQGTCFKCHIAVGLPTASVADALTDQPVRRVIGLPPDHPPMRILVAEDMPDNRLLLVQLLSSRGFEVRTAEDGREAIALWNNWNPHLILMDMRMPILDGYETTRQIKATARGSKTVIIAITASVLEEERMDIFAAGCDDVLCKPFQEQALLMKLAEYLDVQYVYAE